MIGDWHSKSFRKCCLPVTPKIAYLGISTYLTAETVYVLLRIRETRRSEISNAFLGCLQCCSSESENVASPRSTVRFAVQYS